MSGYGELDKGALDAWITRSDDDPDEAAFEKWVEENRENPAFKKEFQDDHLDYDYHPESPEWDDDYDQWLHDGHFQKWLDAQGPDESQEEPDDHTEEN